jgi:hypothetical protein
MKHSNTWFASILIASALLLSGAPNVNGEPSQRRIKQAEKNAVPQNSGTDPADDQRGTESTPLMVKLLNTGKSHEETTQESQRVEKENNTDWWTVRLAIAAVGIGTLQLFAFIWQAIVLGMTIEVSRDTARRQLRAYVAGIPDFMFAFSDSSLPRTRFKLHNSGTTPAHRLRHRTEIEILPNPVEAGMSLPAPSGNFSDPMVLFPNTNFTGNKTRAKVFDTGEISRIRNGTASIYVYGEIEYFDIFENRQTSSFCFRLEADKTTLNKLTSDYGPSDLTLSFAIAPMGNTAT